MGGKTRSEIEAELGGLWPWWRIAAAIRRLRVKPIARVGNTNVYSADAVQLVKADLERVDAMLAMQRRKPVEAAAVAG
jgi:hypothetical protein